MIEIYLKSNTNYKGNGNITLDPTSCIYKDSEKELTLEHFLDEEGRWKYIDFENVIAAEENGKKKLYRIYNVVRSLYSVTAYARPIFYDLADKVLLDVRPTNKLGEEALNIILSDTPFTGHSNLTTVSTSYYIRKNIVEALLSDAENSFINRWGGEFYCENFDVYINDRIGSDNGLRVEFGYNLNEIEEDINIDNVVTRIIPVGYDGLTLEGNEPWVDSPLINKYTQPKMRVIEFSDIKVKENSDDEEGFNTIAEARAELIKRCNELYEGGIDKPVVNYKIDMINLANTTAYEDFKILVNVNKGDTVTCYIPHLDIDVQARVVDFEKDLLTGEYISIELGNTTNDFFKDQADIKNRVDNIFNSNGNVKAETLEGAINALQTQFKALRDVAQQQNVRAILFEDRIEDSPTFGCMCLGTMGFEIASSFKPGTQDWDFRTFGTGKGFVADYIITGILNAALIKAGILKSENETTWINMENGTFNFANKIIFDGTAFDIDLSSKDLTTNESIKAAIKVLNDSISAKVSNGEFSTYKTQTATEISSKVSNGDFNAYKTQTSTDISQKVTKGKEFSTEFNQNAESFNFTLGNGNTAVTIDKNGQTIKNGALTLKNNKDQVILQGDTTGNLAMKVFGSKFIMSATGDRLAEMWCDIDDKFTLQVPYYNKNSGLWIKRDTGATILSDISNMDEYYKIYLAATRVNSLKVLGALTVSGSKNCLQETKNYGERLINAYETAEYYFGDIGSGKIINGECYISIDDILQECVNTDISYHVFTQIYNGSISKIERFKTYFIVRGEEGTEFSWELKAKRKGYENTRLDIVDNLNIENIDYYHTMLDEIDNDDFLKLHNLLLEEVNETENILI